MLSSLPAACANNEYGEDWYELDIDLPFHITHEKDDMFTQHKEDFTNIFLVFDYERQDPKFSKEKIEQIQSYFSDSTDMGKLYINYPMIESYQHLSSLPDLNYASKKISCSLRPRKKYKALVRNSFFDAAFQFPNKLRTFLIENCACNESTAEQLVQSIPVLRYNNNMLDEISTIISEKIPPHKLENANQNTVLIGIVVNSRERR